MNVGEMLLVQLAEEASEVAQRAAKCLRFGMDDVQAPDGKIYDNNHDRLMAEYLDLCCVMEALINRGVVQRPKNIDVDLHFAAKHAKVEKYLELSKLNGRLTECEGVSGLDVQTPKYTRGQVIEMTVNVRDNAWPVEVADYMALILPMLMDYAQLVDRRLNGNAKVSEESTGAYEHHDGRQQ